MSSDMLKTISLIDLIVTRFFIGMYIYSIVYHITISPEFYVLVGLGFGHLYTTTRSIKQIVDYKGENT